ncbi:MAG: hypothetical protein GY841_04440 [FCB group bacterium]|nr:hypothetical protein [FCB group bacterium]
MKEIKNGSGDITIQLYGAVYNSNLLELYSAFGPEFVKYIDGDFALVLQDRRTNVMVVAVDAFASKPLWLKYSENDLIEVFDYPAPGANEKLRANTYKTYCNGYFGSGSSVSVSNVVDWDLTQNVKTYDKWIEAFEESIAKRTKDVADQLFIGLSSGYDSGCIACELKKQNIPFEAYTLIANENMLIIARRQAFHRHNYYSYQITKQEYLDYSNYVINNGVDYECLTNHWRGSDVIQWKYNYKFDKASAGDAFVCDMGNRAARSIMLSGQGSDEIFSDYGQAGRQHYSQSQLGGLFPDDLASVFPYGNFDKGTMDAYIAKTEFIGRLYGVEARYPYLDVDLVQEFLHLTPELKNANYKAPLYEYFARNDYPFDKGVKEGFGANRNLIQE